MSRALLDTNVLLALLDRDHIDHGRTYGWRRAGIPVGGAACAIPEIVTLDRMRVRAAVPAAKPRHLTVL